MKKTTLMIVLIFAFSAYVSSTLWAEDAAPAAAPAAKEEVKKEEPAQDAAKTEPAKPEEKPVSKKLDDPLGFLPDVVAKIGDSQVTKADVLEQAKPLLRAYKKDTSGTADNPAFWQQCAARLIDSIVRTRILYNIAKSANVAVTEKDVDAEIENLKKELKNNMPPIDYDEFLKSQEITEKEIREKITNEGQVAIKKWYDTIIVPSITKEDAEKYYREHQDEYKSSEDLWVASHILIRPEPTVDLEGKMTEEERNAASAKADEAAKKKAQDILVRIKAGEDFGKLAQEFSACPSGKMNGGELPPFPKEAMDKQFEDGVMALKPGEISEPVKSSFGYHIIKFHRKIDAGGFVPFEMVEKDIKGMLADQKAMGTFEKYKADNKIEILFKPEAGALMPPMVPQGPAEVEEVEVEEIEVEEAGQKAPQPEKGN